MLADRHRPDPQRSLLGFVVGDIEYAVPISNVRQIVNPVVLAELPHSPPAVIGVADFRGEVVPIIDMRVRLGLRPTHAHRQTKWILLGVNEQTVGLAVDRVTEVFGTGGGQLRPVPQHGRYAVARAGCCCGQDPAAVGRGGQERRSIVRVRTDPR